MITEREKQDILAALEKKLQQARQEMETADRELQARRAAHNAVLETREIVSKELARFKAVNEAIEAVKKEGGQV